MECRVEEMDSLMLLFPYYTQTMRDVDRFACERMFALFDWLDNKLLVLETIIIMP